MLPSSSEKDLSQSCTVQTYYFCAVLKKASLEETRRQHSYTPRHRFPFRNFRRRVHGKCQVNVTSGTGLSALDPLCSPSSHTNDSTVCISPFCSQGLINTYCTVSKIPTGSLICLCIKPGNKSLFAFCNGT